LTEGPSRDRLIVIINVAFVWAVQTFKLVTLLRAGHRNEAEHTAPMSRGAERELGSGRSDPIGLAEKTPP
jgi:hypothetical protein